MTAGLRTAVGGETRCTSDRAGAKRPTRTKTARNFARGQAPSSPTPSVAAAADDNNKEQRAATYTGATAPNSTDELTSPHRVELRLATGAFVRLGYRPTDEYWATVRRVYGGTVHEVDFVEDSEMVRRQINSWVREHTDHQVKEILTPGSVTSATRLCIVNGVQFRAVWTDPFYETELRRHEFHATNDDEEGSEVEVEMVARIDEYGYIVDRDLCFTAVEVIQKGDKTSLVIVMPHQRHDFHVLEERQNLDKLLDLPNRMTRTPDVELCLPRLKLDMGMRLESILYYMGLADLFSEV
ncbi:hypothetical protein HPB49_014660 [Dermacentor silvarum]|uniref:Uncharacterized protein n=1 Tax=Dermacentor silvarum TaxID=543639 RepID=A0ACB8CFS8_DERSI|nr:hypothetical protein HPB49_014660 [Dermacentor silvarum]